MKPKTKETIYIRELDGEKVIYDKKKGMVHFLNRTATFIFGLCDGNHTENEILEAVLDQYDIEKKTALEDVENVLKSFREKEILAESSLEKK